MSLDEEIKESAIKSFEEIVKHEMLTTESLKELVHKLHVAKVEIEAGLEVELNLGLLEFIR